nr:hypothetical protein [Tanacetum cinerariifolium]
MAQRSCSYCGGPFNDGNCLSCSIVGARDEFFHNPNPFPYDNTPDFYDQPPQHHVEIYSCKLCGNDSHYGYDYPPRFRLVHEQEPSYNQNFGSRGLSHNGDGDLNTIPEKRSDEVIKSSVEDFVPIPSESEDTSGSDSEFDLPSCDDFSPINVPEGKSMIFSNPLFDSNDDFTSSDDESLSDEDVLEDNDIESKASYDSNLDEPDLLVTPLFDSNEDECFDPRGDVDEINAFDIPSDLTDGYYDSKGDVLYLESLLSDDTTPNLPPKVFLGHDPRSLSDVNDLKIMVKVFDP